MKSIKIIALLTLILGGTIAWIYQSNANPTGSQAKLQVSPPVRKRWPLNLPDKLAREYSEASAGKTEAQLVVGNYFYDRSRNDDDLIEAAFWFTQASIGEPAMPEAIGKLAECHYKGFGVKQDREWAKYLYISAAERGYKGAYWDAGMYSKEPDKKFSFFKSGAEAGDIGSQHALGICLIDGIGTSKNYKEAVIWLERAAYGGNISSILALGSFHAEDPSIESQIEAYAMYNSTLSLPKSDDQLLDSAVKLRAIEPRLNREQLKQAQNRTAQILGEIAKRKQSSGQAKKAR
jgi:TPR repeat protein